MKKGQSANELAAIIGVMTMFMIAFVAVISEKLIEATDENMKAVAEDLADVVDSELSLASTAHDGYNREFRLPDSLNGNYYGILLYNRSNTNANFTQLVINITISGFEYSAVRVLPENIEGVLSVGDNLVKKQNGIVNITAPPEII